MKTMRGKRHGKPSEESMGWNEEKDKNSPETPKLPGLEAFVEDVEMMLLENTPAIPTTSMHNYSKTSKATVPKQQAEENLEVLQEESNAKLFKKVTNKPDCSTEKKSSNLVEQVACFKCKFCLFLSLSQEAVSSHVKKEHALQVPNEGNISMQCPGCSNVFFSQKSLRVHLAEDHNVAQEELENLLSTLKTVDALETGKPITSVVSGKKKVEQLRDGPVETITLVESIDTAEDGKQSAEIQKSQPKRSARIFSRNAVTPSPRDPEKSAPFKTKVTLKSAPGDETRKIRVRNMLTLENAVQKTSSNENAEANSTSASTVAAFSTEDSLSSDVILVEKPSDRNLEENIQMEIQYDMDSMQTMQILDIPLDEQPHDSQEDLIHELSEQAHGTGKIITSIVEDGGQRYCTVPASPISCEAIIDEICQEEVLESVLYIEEGDDRQSPIMVCFAASQDSMSGNDEAYDVEMDDNSSALISMTKRQDEGSPERLILTSYALDGSNLIAANGKKLVKRGFVKRSPPKKTRAKKPKTMKNRISKAGLSSDEPTIAGYKCNFYGCTVRLLSHDNMEYHQRCHITTIPDDAEKISSESENIPGQKRGRLLHSKRVFICPECFVEMHTWKLMKSHLWKFHSIDMELYSCDQCGYKTPSLSNMKNVHSKIHGSEKPYLCDCCGKGFKTTKQLRNHKTIHVRKDMGMEACEICGRSFHTNRMLRNHINTVHNKVRPYMCSECGHTAANRSSLKMHLRQHTGDRPYGCDQCDYTTSDHNSLRRHKKRHTGDKPYKCPYCNYACIQSTTFKIHLRSKHPGQDSDLMFSCKKCPFHSVNRDIYLSHIAEHDLSEASGIPFKSKPRPTQRRAKNNKKVSEETSLEEIPIFVSIASEEPVAEREQPNLENIVQHVSEAILPGSNLHALYNSISLSDSSKKGQDSACEPSNSAVLQDPIIHIVDDESELELVAEANNAEELECKLQDKEVSA